MNMKHLKLTSNGHTGTNRLNGRIPHTQRISPEISLPGGNSHPLLDDPFKDLPVLGYINQDPDLRARQPFRGIGVVALLHMFPNCLATVKTWLDLGAEPDDVTVFYKQAGYGYDSDDSVKSALRALGVCVLPVGKLNGEFFDQFEAQLTARDLQFIVCEDGGIAAPQILKKPSLLARCLGFVEQTTKGLWRTKAVTARPAKPYLALPLSEFKQKFEPPHVALAFVRTFDTFLAGYRALRDMRIAVLGCNGCIGKAIANLLLDFTSQVTVFDKNLPRLDRLLLSDFKIADSASEAVTDADGIISCTGSRAVGLKETFRVKDGCVFGSASSEQEEFPIPTFERIKESSEPFIPPGLSNIPSNSRGTIYRLRPHGKRVVLLNHGFPLNFAYGANLNPYPFDLVMALLLAGTIELALGKYDGKRGFLNVFDEIDTRYQLSETYLNIHRSR